MRFDDDLDDLDELDDYGRREQEGAERRALALHLAPGWTEAGPGLVALAVF